MSRNSKAIPLEIKQAALAEYAAGGVDCRYISKKYQIAYSRLFAWLHEIAPPRSERKCSQCGATPPLNAKHWHGIILCRSCKRARKAARNKIYEQTHAEERKAKKTPWAELPASVKRKQLDAISAKYYRNQEILKRIYDRMLQRIGLMKGVAFEGVSVIDGEAHFNDPIFVFVDPKGRKHLENLQAPLPTWPKPKIQDV